MSKGVTEMPPRNNARGKNNAQLQFVDTETNKDQMSFVDLDCVDAKSDIWGRVVAIAHCPKCGLVFEVIQK